MDLCKSSDHPRASVPVSGSQGFLYDLRQVFRTRSRDSVRDAGLCSLQEFLASSFFSWNPAVNKPSAWLLSVLVVVVCAMSPGTCLQSDSSELSADPGSAVVEEGFVPLFDGKSLAGWEGNEQLWKAEDDMIVGDSQGIKQNEFLATKKSYGDFELRLEFRLRKGVGNSGIQFRSKRVAGSSEISGYQADIGEKYWGCLYDESRRNKVLVQAPVELEKALHKEDWNGYVIRAVGDQITLSLAGVTTVDYRESDQTIAREGIIALQVHAGGPLRVEFRKLRIKEL